MAQRENNRRPAPAIALYRFFMLCLTAWSELCRNPSSVVVPTFGDAQWKGKHGQGPVFEARSAERKLAGRAEARPHATSARLHR